MTFPFMRDPKDPPYWLMRDDVEKINLHRAMVNQMEKLRRQQIEYEKLVREKVKKELCK